MKTIRVDAIRVEACVYCPAVVRADDGRLYRTLGVVTDSRTCHFPVTEAGGGTFGRRLCVLLGDVVEEPTPDAAGSTSPPAAPPEKVAGCVGKGSGV